MTLRSLTLITALVVATPALAQDRHGRQRDPGAVAQSSGGEHRGGGDHQAGPREAGQRSDSGRREREATPPPAAAPAPAPAPATAAPPARAGQAPADPDRRSAQPWRYPSPEENQGGSRIIRVPPPAPAAPATPAAAAPPVTAQVPGALDQRSAQRRRDPGPDNRQAVPRRGLPPRADDRRDDRRVIYGRPRVYNNYYYYPRRYYPYGYGAFGLGYFYYDPYAWGPTYYGGYSGYDPYYDRGYPTGELRLDINPSFAEVYVDGYFAGLVDDFDGVFQALRLEEGPHQIRVVAPGFAPLDFDVRIYAGRKVSYRGDLLRLRP